MKSVKKKYMKPSIKVVEWDFNEAVCTDGIMTLSVNRCIKSETGRVEVNMNNFNGTLNWHDYDDVTSTK